jgi:drug/metabolite transporter (DMT)-like permease
MPVLQALLAALTFGLSAPISKLLLTTLSPLLLAGLLYLGAGVFLSAVRLLGRGRRAGRPVLTTAQSATLAGAVAAGGILAPPLLLWGLAHTPASSTALLLNLEVGFTALLAGIMFREHLGARVAAAAMLMTLGGMSLTWTGGRPGLSLPALAVVGASALWALDNNLTRLISDLDAVFLAQVKGLVAGAVNLGLALSVGQRPSGWVSSLLGLALGAVSYGSSLVLFILAMRALGAARTAAYFALAPFFGAAGSTLFLGEPLSSRLFVAAGLMGVGAYMLIRERHVRLHRHAPGIHTHRHIHDEHHQHRHEGWEGEEPHMHPHATGPLEHKHACTPDAHP